MTTHATSGPAPEPLTEAEGAYVELGRASLRDAGFVVVSELVLRTPVPEHAPVRVRIEYATPDGACRGVTSLRPSSAASLTRPGPTVLASLSRTGPSAAATPRDLGRLALELAEVGRDPSSWVTNVEYAELAAVVGALPSGFPHLLTSLESEFGPARMLLVRAVVLSELDPEPFRVALRALSEVVDGAPLAWVMRHLETATDAR